MYSVVLAGMSDSVQNMIILRLKELSKNPFITSIKLKSVELGMYREKIGNFRIVFDIVDENLIVLRIGHRKSVYKR